MVKPNLEFVLTGSNALAPSPVSVRRTSGTRTCPVCDADWVTMIRAAQSHW